MHDTLPPFMRGRIRFAPDAFSRAFAQTGHHWQVERRPEIAYRDEHIDIDARVPRRDAVLARSGSRTLVVLGECAFIDTDSAPDVGGLCDALDRDPLATLRELRGPFVLLYVDAVRRSLVFATDRAATRSPCYAVMDADVVVGLTARDVAGALARRPAIRAQGIYDYLYFHAIPAPGTIFDGVRRLLPGEALRIDDGTARVASYWTPSYEPATVRPRLADAKAEFRTLLRDAIATQLDHASIGTFLSGGTDSSTVAGMLGVVSGQPARTYSIGFDVEGFDEMRYARIASRHFGTRHHEYYVTPDDLVSTIPLVAASFDQPFGNSSAVPAYFCARLAASDGVTKLLAGDGGDELFGGNTRYARQRLFEAYGAIPAALARALEVPLRWEVASRMTVFRKARSYIEQAKVPMPARMHTYNLVDHVGPETIFEPDFVSSIDTAEPARLQANYYARCPDPSIVNRMLHYDWKFTLADNDLPKVVGACDLAGVEVGFPLLDERIAEFANRLPVEWKVRRMKLRHFFKVALADFLPREIIRKQKHGFGLPFGQWLVTHPGLRELASGSLESLRDRGVVRPAFFADLLERVTTQHAGFYGELVWLMMMLEHWLAAHSADYRFRSAPP